MQAGKEYQCPLVRTNTSRQRMQVVCFVDKRPQASVQARFIQSIQRECGCIQRSSPFAEFVLGDVDSMRTLRQAYIEDISHRGVWAAEPEAIALADIFCRQLVFWTVDRNGRYVHIRDIGNGERLHILRHGAHFEAIRIIPQEGEVVDRDDIEPNDGGGDCLYMAFHQGYYRNGTVPPQQRIVFYRSLVTVWLRQERHMDFTGLLTTLLDEYDQWGIIAGAGERFNALVGQYRQHFLSFFQQGVPGIIGAAFGRPIKERDTLSRRLLSRSERMLDRIGRLVATKTSVHVAVALDKDVIVVSCNADIDQVRLALVALCGSFASKDGSIADPISSPSDRRVGNDSRRKKDLRKMTALKTGSIDALQDPSFPLLQRIRRALQGGVYESSDKYEQQVPGIYLITPPGQTEGRGVVHGEMHVTEAIYKRRHAFDNENSENVYVGGTLVDCFDCNRMHKARNARLEQEEATWRFHTGGTHGNSYPNWLFPRNYRGSINTDFFRSQRGIPGRVEERLFHRSRQDRAIESSHSTFAEDSDSDTEDTPNGFGYESSIQHIAGDTKNYRNMLARLYSGYVGGNIPFPPSISFSVPTPFSTLMPVSNPSFAMYKFIQIRNLLIYGIKLAGQLAGLIGVQIRMPGTNITLNFYLSEVQKYMQSQTALVKQSDSKKIEGIIKELQMILQVTQLGDIPVLELQKNFGLLRLG